MTTNQQAVWEAREAETRIFNLLRAVEKSVMP